MKLQRPLALALIFAPALASAQANPALPPPASMRPWVLLAVDRLARDSSHGGYAGGGYDAHRRYTHDLPYGDKGLKATTPHVPGKPPLPPFPTMCVAAVIETMVEALDLYTEQTKPSLENAYYTKFPLSRVDGDSRTQLIPLVFKYKGSDSPGTGYALASLGLGTELPFDKLQPGDFVTFNRTNTKGHAVVFLGYLKRGSDRPTPVFSADVIGFRYFSAQGAKRPDAGLGYRNVYLAGVTAHPHGPEVDCCVDGLIVHADGTVQQNHLQFSAGELLVPEKWRVKEALADLRTVVSRGFENDPLLRGEALDRAVDAKLAEHLRPDVDAFDDGTSD